MTGRRGDGATGRRKSCQTRHRSPLLPSSVAPSPRRSVSPALLVIWARGFLSRLSFGVISFALPIFAYKRLGLSLTQTGFLFAQPDRRAVVQAVDGLGRGPSGAEADADGGDSASQRGPAGAPLRPPLQVYAIRFFHGFTESLRDPSVNALIAANAKKKSMASAFAWYSTAKMSAGSMARRWAVY